MSDVTEVVTEEMERGGGNEAGSGTGEDISEYSFTAWTLSPGAGGKCYSYGSSSYYYGGGGGGVMVDGLGPEASQYQGQGYGGGGNRYSSYSDGLKGVILLEVKAG